MIVDVGERQYELVEGWGEFRPGWIWGQVGAVSVDSDDNVHVFTRAEHPYRVYDKSGKVIDSWGEGIFEDAHGRLGGLDLRGRDPGRRPPPEVRAPEVASGSGS